MLLLIIILAWTFKIIHLKIVNQKRALIIIFYNNNNNNQRPLAARSERLFVWMHLEISYKIVVVFYNCFATLKLLFNPLRHKFKLENGVSFVTFAQLKTKITKSIILRYKRKSKHNKGTLGTLGSSPSCLRISIPL